MTERKRPAVALFCLIAAAAWGSAPSARMATLRWSGDGEFRSWRWEKLGEAFDDGAAQYAAESRIVSPTWAELDVLGAEVPADAGEQTALLEKLSGEKAPAALAGVLEREVRFKDVIDPKDMMQYVQGKAARA